MRDKRPRVLWQGGNPGGGKRRRLREMKGTIKNMPPNKTFCFIRGTNGAEYFLHKSDYNGHWDDLVADYTENKKENGGDIEVTFDVQESAKGPRAGNCRRVDFPNQAV